jgi:uncharacterized protein YkwD
MSHQSTIETDILDLINQQRASKDLPPMSAHQTVYEHTLQHANNIASGNVPFGHHRFADRIKLLHQQFKLTAASENVAMGQKTAAEVFSSWMSSEKHRQNIEGDFNLTGIAVVQNNSGTNIFTQIYAKTLEEISQDPPEEDQYYLVSSKASNSLNQKILLFVNEYRIQQQLMPLETKSEIEVAATAHAQNMADEQIPLGHDGFESRAQTLIHQIDAHKVGENVAVGPADARAITDSWLKSPKHLKNICSDFSYTGIAVVSNDEDQFYYCQIFVK